MTDFAKTLQELCCRENISIKTALYNAVPHLNTNRLSERILTTDAIPDLTTITARRPKNDNIESSSDGKEQAKES